MFGVMASFFPFELLRKVEDPGSYTIRSHGAALARVHLYDWLLLLLLVASVAVLNIIEPFHRFVGKDMMTDLKFPLKPNTIPTWSVPLYAVALPIIIFGLFYLKRRNVFDLHQATLGILYSVLITGVITDSIKDGVGRPRPNFFWRCFPDGNAVFDQLGDVVCHGIEDVVKEGYKSFPSGHSSWSFAGLGFLSLYLAGKIKAFDKRGQIRKLCVVILPILAAAMVAVSRVDDYWHHWQDVFAGALIGIGYYIPVRLNRFAFACEGYAVAFFCYHQFFPPPHHTQGWCPHAYFRTLEETCTNNVQPDEYHHTVEINGQSSLLQAT